MDLSLQPLSGSTHLAPIAHTLRRVFTPDFTMPEAFVRAIAQIDPSRMDPHFVSHFDFKPSAQHAALG